jgi:SAM-dependent methyltransferase
MMKGLSADMENGELFIARNKGYSFCNCRNIFFTDWKNINQEIYDDLYFEKYKCNGAKQLADEETKKMFSVFKKYNPEAKSFFEVGAIHDYVMDRAKEFGYEPEGLDIAPHGSKYPLITCSFEQLAPSKKYDIIWASHVFEHFKDPIEALRTCEKMLTEKGLLFVAMPDTFFIDFDHNMVMQWDWVVDEHHILWSMDEWIQLCGEQGWKCLWAERNTDLSEREKNEWFWKRDFKVVLCRQ